MVAARARKLNIDCHQGVGDKFAWLTSYFAKEPGPGKVTGKDAFRGLVYLGNDLNDLPVMQVAGFSVAPHDAHPVIKKQVSVVLPQNGGDGFIRAFVERLLNFETLSLGELNELVSNR